MIPLILALHTLAAVVWVGGIFYTLIIFRPAVGSLANSLGERTRLELWQAVLGRFFHWVWGCVAVLLLTGYGVVIFGYEGFSAIGLHIQIMQITGIIMIALFLFLWGRPWQEFRHAVERGDVPAAQHFLAQIRAVAIANLLLGLFTAAIGATGGFWTY
ncbi:MAG TPA: CopD family protein [Candidatus Sulfotelmatobacter sp.]|jgi:uncharacterized membrane protein|nr:CopD family protein [Candidatus Sulfotelmatobacter sp.]